MGKFAQEGKLVHARSTKERWLGQSSDPGILHCFRLLLNRGRISFNKFDNGQILTFAHYFYFIIWKILWQKGQ
jgi:hypothetical protein